MRKHTAMILCLGLFVLFLTRTASAQLGVRAGIKGGYNSSIVAGDDVNGAERLQGITGGLSLEMNLLIIALQADAMYSPRGASVNGEDLRLTYFSLPVVAKIKFFPLLVHPYLLGGPEFNFLLSAKADGNDIKNTLKSQSISAVAGAGLEFSLFGKSAYGEVRYCHGLTNISDVEGTELFDRTYQILFGFLF
ncbi:PorT family protein [bacterium]|nr:PorT family protein [bacterium]